MKKMKKVCLLVCLLILSLSALEAEDLFTFEVLPDSPLYKEATADPYSYSTYVRVISALGDQRPNKIKSIVIEHDPDDTTGANDRAFYAFLPYADYALSNDNKNYVNMKTAVSLGLFRVRFNGKDWIPTIDFEVTLAGYINTLFNLFGGTNTLDFDGSYFFGSSLRLADTVTFRFGIHHFSGHYGDEILQTYYAYNEADFTDMYNFSALFDYAKTYSDADKTKKYYLSGPVEYVRDNSWMLAVSADLPWGFRIYGEAELPQNPSWLRPFVHVPADYDNQATNSSETLVEQIGNSENVPKAQFQEEENLKRTSNGSYKAWRLHAGIEWRINVGFGAIFAAADLQFHQDGQTLHQIGGYSKDNPWEIEVTVGGGLELGNILEGKKTVRIEAYYHNGRVPATQWFYQRLSCVTVGIGIN
jgi:hypothetical protein